MVDSRHLIDGEETSRILGITRANLHARTHRKQLPEGAIVRIGSQVVYDRRVIEKMKSLVSGVVLPHYPKKLTGKKPSKK
ncbi:MAG: hypothetical protein K2X36_04450 [Microbacteriaceae bacterium]|nr:hypothetical protein [Microbacteriaceae bacterium]